MPQRITVALLVSIILLVLMVVSLATVQALAPRQERIIPDPVIFGTLRVQPATYITAGTQTLTPLHSMYFLAPTDTATITLSTASAQAGDILILVGTVATNTVISDTGATATGSSRTVGNTDVLDLFFNGSVWAERSFSDNQ